MSEFLNDKDYGDYFRKLQSEIESSENPIEDIPLIIEETEQERRAIKRAIRLNPVFVITVLAIIVFAVFALIMAFIPKKDDGTAYTGNNKVTVSDSREEEENLRAEADENTVEPSDEINSSHLVMINTDTNKIIASRASDVRTSPASTTKIMTALVACENTKNFDDTFEMIIEITDPIFLSGSTSAGFEIGEVITITDMLYGCILPSGGDAALGLAYKIAGSEEAFVKLMNQKAEELGLQNTHFENVTGLYHENHYTTASDMAVILSAAMKNAFCRKLLSTFQYTTTPNAKHPEGITMTSTLFSYMYGTEPETAQIDGGKTGYVNESGFCIASYGHALDGTEYICVTLDADSRWPAVFDQIELYKQYAK